MTEPHAASTAPIPDALRASVLERMRRLAVADRSVILCASAIGRRFSAGVLGAASKRSPERIRAALERACGLQLLEDEGAATARFAFRHALTRDVVYAELIASRTRPLHRRIARALERARAEDESTLEQLAYHWWAAGDARRGVHYNERAGDAAAAVHAPAAALLHYGRALALARAGSGAHRRLARKLRSARPPAGE